jgi:hypothetical protein
MKQEKARKFYPAYDSIKSKRALIGKAQHFDF